MLVATLKNGRSVRVNVEASTYARIKDTFGTAHPMSSVLSFGWAGADFASVKALALVSAHHRQEKIVVDYRTQVVAVMPSGRHRVVNEFDDRHVYVDIGGRSSMRVAYADVDRFIVKEVPA